MSRRFLIEHFNSWRSWLASSHPGRRPGSGIGGGDAEPQLPFVRQWRGWCRDPPDQEVLGTSCPLCETVKQKHSAGSLAASVVDDPQLVVQISSLLSSRSSYPVHFVRSYPRLKWVLCKDPGNKTKKKYKKVILHYCHTHDPCRDLIILVSLSSCRSAAVIQIYGKQSSLHMRQW